MLIGIEADKPDADAPLEARRAPTRRRAASTVEVVPCEVRYPQGAERQLVTALTGRVVPPRALPLAVGVLVQNVATAVAVYEALRFRRPLLDRVITVTGPGIRDPRNVRAPLGTLLSQHRARSAAACTDDTTRHDRRRPDDGPRAAAPRPAAASRA